MTRYEAVALLSLSGLLIIGLGARYVQQRTVPVPVGAYDEMDRLFFERSAADVEDGAARPSGATGRAASVPSGSPVPPGTASAASASNAGSTTLSGPVVQDGTPSSDASLRVDINTADQAQLETLPRVGPATARRILAFRADFGPFTSVEDLRQVRGIGEKTVELLRPHVRVSIPEVESDHH